MRYSGSPASSAAVVSELDEIRRKSTGTEYALVRGQRLSLLITDRSRGSDIRSEVQCLVDFRLPCHSRAYSRLCTRVHANISSSINDQSFTVLTK